MPAKKTPATKSAAKKTAPSKAAKPAKPTKKAAAPAKPSKKKAAAPAKPAKKAAPVKADKTIASAAKPASAAKKTATALKPSAAPKRKGKGKVVEVEPAAPPWSGEAQRVLTIGQAAPPFALPGDDGKTHTLATHKGRNVIVYFYPRDDTPGCTVQACDFRDNLARALGKGAVVLGVSRDSLKSHARFRTKHGLNFPLLSDEDLAAHRAYGAWGAKVMYGKEVEGTIRSTFLIDGRGTLRATWTKVRVPGHVDEVLRALDDL